MALPSAFTVQEQYSHHLRYDAGAGGNSAAGAQFSQDFMTNLYGHRCGVGNSTPWSTPPTRPLPGVYQDSNSGGTVSYTATTLVDSAKAWKAGDANLGGTVTYAAGTITDTARNNATGWVVGNTAAYVGIIIVTATGKVGIGASAAAGVITLAANWSGGTPAAGEAYTFYPSVWVNRAVFAQGTGGAITKLPIIYNVTTTITGTAWTNGTPAGSAAYIIGPDTAAGATAKFYDNWWANLRLIYNPANL